MSTKIDSSFLTNHTCINISNPENSIKFYQDAFGMKIIKEIEIKDLKFKSWFLAFDGENQPFDGKYFADRTGVIELRQDLSKDLSKIEIYSGNSEPYKGFGHLCISVDNIVEAEKHLLSIGVTFKKKLSDGRQKNIAFVLDPDGYWIELIENEINKTEGKSNIQSYRMNHSMIRVRDPKESLKFYRDLLGMKLYSTRDFPDAKFTLYFLGYEHDPNYVENLETSVPQACRFSIVELTHNWGTENDDSFEGYYAGDKDSENNILGFQHIGISCNDPNSFVKQIEDKVKWVVPFNSNSNLKNIGVFADPDGYKIEILPTDALKA
ncbi:hypothetical protein B5S28_g333 [[Candida] boidinii]|nr:hypothetical protein B5S28_g333 [[Candida] boidinii]